MKMGEMEERAAVAGSRTGGAGEHGAAVLAFAVAEVVLVNHVAQAAASNRARCGAEQAAQQGTSDTTQRDADRARNSTERSTNLGTGPGAGSAAGSSGDTAEGSSGIAADLAGGHVCGFADGTNSHGELLAMDAKKPGARERAPGLRLSVRSDQREAGQVGLPRWQWVYVELKGIQMQLGAARAALRC